MANLNISIPTETKKAFKTKTFLKDLTMSEVAVELIERYLADESLQQEVNEKLAQAKAVNEAVDS